jgi:hypothetical protein
MSAVITPVLEVSEIRCDGGPQEFANEETIVYSYEIDGAIPFEIEFICDQKRIIGRPTKNTVNGQDRYSIEVEVVVVHIGDLKKIQIAAGCKVGCGSCGMQVRNYVLPVRDNFKDCGGSSWIVDANDIAISTRFELLSLQMTGNNSPQFVVSAVPLAEWGIVHQ